MESKTKKVKNKNAEDQCSNEPSSGFGGSKPIKLKVGEYVWCTNNGLPYMLGKMAYAGDDVPEAVKRSRKSNTILIQFLHDSS
jgi:hypothetical protein